MRESNESLLALHVSLVGGGVARCDHYVEFGRLVPVGAELDFVRARVHVELLENTVEAVDHPHVIPVDIDLGISGLDFQTERSGALVMWDITAATRRFGITPGTGIAAGTGVAAASAVITGIAHRTEQERIV